MLHAQELPPREARLEGLRPQEGGDAALLLLDGQIQGRGAILVLIVWR